MTNKPVWVATAYGNTISYSEVLGLYSSEKSALNETLKLLKADFEYYIEDDNADIMQLLQNDARFTDISPDVNWYYFRRKFMRNLRNGGCENPFGGKNYKISVHIMYDY